MRAVDQDVADIRVLHIGLQRPQAERFGDQFFDESLFVDGWQLARARAEHPFGQAANVFAQLFVGQASDSRQIERVEQLTVNTRLEALKFSLEILALQEGLGVAVAIAVALASRPERIRKHVG